MRVRRNNSDLAGASLPSTKPTNAAAAMIAGNGTCNAKSAMNAASEWFRWTVVPAESACNRPRSAGPDLLRAIAILLVILWLIEVSAEFSAKLPADLLAAECDHRQRWPKNWRRERDSKSGRG
jgi:hypothetical protein